MKIIAIDPGTEVSALVVYEPEQRRVVEHAILPNDEIIAKLEAMQTHMWANGEVAKLVIEEFESYGMAVGREVFKTVWWAGRFYQVWTISTRTMLVRRVVKLHICHSSRATDANIRQEIIDNFGGQLKAVGKKHDQGPLYGLKGHEFAALALAITHAAGEPIP